MKLVKCLIQFNWVIRIELGYIKKTDFEKNAEHIIFKIKNNNYI